MTLTISIIAKDQKRRRYYCRSLMYIAAPPLILGGCGCQDRNIVLRRRADMDGMRMASRA
jgi:hypothetical protein